MGWDISEKMVEALLAEKVPGIDSKLKALLVFQHCTVHSMSLFDFLAKFRVDGLRVVSICDPPLSRPSEALVDEVPEEDLARRNWPEFQFAEWRAETLSSARLEKLRLHLREVQEGIERGQFGDLEYVNQLKEFEASLSRVVEPVPTLGLLPDEPAAEVSGVAAESPEQEPEAAESETSSDPLPVVPVSAEAEQAEIAAVLANPKAAQPVSSEPRKDHFGRLLASDAQLQEIYDLGEQLGMNRIQVEESLCAKNKLRKMDDLPEIVAAKIIKKMKDRKASS